MKQGMIKFSKDQADTSRYDTQVGMVKQTETEGERDSLVYLILQMNFLAQQRAIFCLSGELPWFLALFRPFDFSRFST
jgi:hypothetical protein